jgi:hypothetical protein
VSCDYSSIKHARSCFFKHSIPFTIIIACVDAQNLSTTLNELFFLLFTIGPSESKRLCTIRFHNTHPDDLRRKDEVIDAVMQQAKQRGASWFFDLFQTADALSTTTAHVIRRLEFLRVS